MKNILKITFAAAIIGISFTSCKTTDEIEMARLEKPVVEIVESSITVAENGSGVINITTAEPVDKPLTFKLVQIGGTAVKGEDYTFDLDSDPDYGIIGGKIVIAPYQTTGTLTINGMTDFEIDNKSATFELRSMESMNGVTNANNKVSISFEDYTEDDLTIQLFWDVDSADVESCSQDLDLYLGNASNLDISHSWNDCPEQVVLHATDADDDYLISVDYWTPSDVTVDAGDPAEYNTSYYIKIGQVGVSSQIIEGTSSSSNYLNWSAYAAYGGDGFKPAVVQINKTGTNYTIQ